MNGNFISGVISGADTTYEKFDVIAVRVPKGKATGVKMSSSCIVVVECSESAPTNQNAGESETADRNASRPQRR